MATFLISYDLKQPGRDYEDLYKRIKSYPTWCHPVESTWFVVSESNCEKIRNHLSPALDKNDRLIVADMAGNGAWSGMSTTITNWLKKNL